MQEAPDFLDSEETEEAPQDSGTLERLQSLAAEVRDLDAEKTDLEERLSSVKRELHEKLHVDIPDLMDTAGVSELSIPPDGNKPGLKVSSNQFFKANIAASWPEDRRAEAFRYLESIGHGDLIKTEVSVAFPRDDQSKAGEFVDKVRDQGLVPIRKENVHPQTLTAWLKESVVEGHVVPDLEKIGGIVGRVAKIETTT